MLVKAEGRVKASSKAKRKILPLTYKSRGVEQGARRVMKGKLRTETLSLGNGHITVNLGNTISAKRQKEEQVCDECMEYKQIKGLLGAKERD